MTLAVAIKATDAIIVAADSRGTVGDPRGLTAVNDTMQKVFQLGRCALALAGASEAANALLDEIARRGLNNPQNIDEGLAVFAQGAIIFDQWYRNIPPEQRPGTAFLLGGYRHVGGVDTPFVYLLTSNNHFAPQLGNNYPLMVGVPQYAIYLSHRYYDPGMNGNNAAALAEYLISETASQDPKVGGPVRMARVTAAAGYQALTDAEVDALKKANQKLNVKLKRFFVG